jgi:flagellar basal-body rod modification protein FlgD
MINSTQALAGTPAPVTGASGSTNNGATGVAGTTLGGTNFLTLMLAQLKNQNPTSPVDSNAFLSQLASLSEVQGITQLNTSFATLSNSLSSSQALQASSLLGHQALVASSSANLAANSSLSGAINVPQSTSQVVLNISDAGGALVKQINMGAQSTGLVNFNWDGKRSDGSQAPAGKYKLSAQIAGVSGSTAGSTSVSGIIESVSMGAGQTGLTLNIGGLGAVPFSSVQQITN